MKGDNGGPAFPREDYQCNGADGSLGQEGMSMRDYFATKAMQGAIANNSFADTGSDHEIEWVVRLSYKYADAMLKARGE
ncbi:MULTISPECIES: hypothetical protein [Hafnia]|uniref:hypothetical protein n=1 Tax=Hafnia TaxID=568 RepID=UPI001034AACD|nr:MULTISPECIES: hypothetical protein [Hafnia]MCQ4169700.1 hypothetical protein [Hafnia paralvei]TBL60745.1 hypothetical protein EYY92_10940 [Hafnia alvei]